jgi:hypothetical protein
MTEAHTQTLRRTGGQPPDPRSIFAKMKTISKGNDA